LVKEDYHPFLMKFPSVSRFFDFITHKYSINRKELAQVMGVEMTTVYNFLAGFSSPRKNVLSRLAEVLNEDLDVFEGLCYPPDKKGYSVGIATYPGVRFDIVTTCDCKGSRVEIIRKDGHHPSEAYVAGYAKLILDDVQSLEHATQNQVMSQRECLNALELLEKDPKLRRKAFRLIGRWLPIPGDQFVFENLPPQVKPVLFFEDPDSALAYKNKVSTLNLEEEKLIAHYRKLPNHQKDRIKEAIREKLVYVNIESPTSSSSLT